MLGFAFEFSTFMGFLESVFFFGLVISGNSYLFYVYFIWDSEKSGGSAGNSGDCCERKPLTEAKVVDEV